MRVAGSLVSWSLVGAAVSVGFLIACGSSTSSAAADAGATSGGDDTADVAQPAPAYTQGLLDAVHIGSDSAKPDFQKATSDAFTLASGPFASVKLVVDLASACFPFSKWANDEPPSGQRWPTDCDAFDRNFESSIVDPSAPATTPAIELVRAITPFGGPMHIESDVTDVFNAITTPRTFQIVIPTWSDGAGQVSGSNGGWTVSAHLEVTPGDRPRNVLAVIPLVNADIGPTDVPAAAPFTLPDGTTSSKIEYRVTGHGGGNGIAPACIGPADEFCQRVHHALVDGAEIAKVTPWRTDCAKGCTALVHNTNPTLTYCKENPCGDQNSVKASRANWCPGSETPPITWKPSVLSAPGDHAFSYAIDGIGDGGSWRVTALLYAYGD